MIKTSKEFPKKEETRKITKDTLIGEAISINPKIAGLMFEHGLHCVGCFASNLETIEQGAKMHGLSDKEIEKMIEDINKLIL